MSKPPTEEPGATATPPAAPPTPPAASAAPADAGAKPAAAGTAPPASPAPSRLAASFGTAPAAAAIAAASAGTGAAPAAKPPAPTTATAAPAAAATPPGARAPTPPPAGPARAAPSRSVVPVLTAAGFVLVLVAGAWLYNNQRAFDERLAALAVPPPVPAPSVAPARVAALEAQVKALSQQLADLANRPPPPAAGPAVDASAAVAAQVTTLEQRLQDDETRATQLAAKATLAQRVQQAQLALDAGQPLGDLPGAPAALARFATAKPPTEAALRLAFPAAAAAAAQASQPARDGKSLGERILLHASTLLTVRQGDHVVVGAPATTVLELAAVRLEAGDLAGTLAQLDALDGSAAKAIAGWRDNAQALLDARAALALLGRS